MAIDYGTAGSGVQATEHGDEKNRVVILTVDTTLPAIAGGADLAVGKLLYTFPEYKAIIVHGAYMDITPSAEDGNIIADTPDVGIGTVIGSGAVAVLSGTATFENILTGQTATDCNGTAVEAVVDAALTILPTAAHTVYLNAADGWAASGETALPVKGKVGIKFTILN